MSRQTWKIPQKDNSTTENWEVRKVYHLPTRLLLPFVILVVNFKPPWTCWCFCLRQPFIHLLYMHEYPSVFPLLSTWRKHHPSRSHSAELHVCEALLTLSKVKTCSFVPQSVFVLIICISFSYTANTSARQLLWGQEALTLYSWVAWLCNTHLLTWMSQHLHLARLMFLVDICYSERTVLIKLIKSLIKLFIPL